MIIGAAVGHSSHDLSFAIPRANPAASSKQSRGLKIASYYWPASPEVKLRGVVLAVHGHGLYLLHEFLRGQGPGQAVLYEGSWIQEWNKAGFSVCGIDQQSHGFSESIYGFRCYVDTFDHYVEDVLHFASILQRSDVEGFSQLPLFLCGESLGGCIAVHAIARLGRQFKGAILLSPMLSLEKTASKGINYYLRPVATLLSWVFPTWALVATDRNTMFPELQKEWDMDPLAWHGRTRVRVASEYLRASKNVLKRMHTFTFPFLCFHSEEDTLTDPEGSKLLHQRSKASDKTLVHPKAMWHSLVKEKGNAELLELTISWMLDRC
ncbi:hypothetical protein WJX84_004174 [Apatococcus fuscideae]|uniref:Serine aminopeptidase S33 domain-containing protein n=1 Tax=Apatococcus fuscideae TaxID=2026836 RepID=A0AAW1SPN5_9CHLO